MRQRSCLSENLQLPLNSAAWDRNFNNILSSEKSCRCEGKLMDHSLTQRESKCFTDLQHRVQGDSYRWNNNQLFTRLLHPTYIFHEPNLEYSWDSSLSYLWTQHIIFLFRKTNDTGNVYEGKNNGWKCAVNALCYSMPFDLIKHQQLLIWQLYTSAVVCFTAVQFNTMLMILY